MPHLPTIQRWVDQGKDDAWIAGALGTTPGSIQSFRSRKGIYRQARPRGSGERVAQAGLVSAFEGVLDHGEEDGWGLWFDATVADDAIWREHWQGVESVGVRMTRDAIVLEPRWSDDPSSGQPKLPGALSAIVESTDGGENSREQGRVRWFDPTKGFGFITRPTGEDLFVHRSEVRADPELLKPGRQVVYEIGSNEQGPVARGLSPLDTDEDSTRPRSTYHGQ